MIKKWVYILGVLSTLQIYSQNFEVTFSSVEKGGARELHDRIIGYDSTSFDVLRYKFSPFGEATLFADHFDKNSGMRLYSIEVYKKDLYKNNSIKYKTEFQHVFVIDSSLIVLFSTYNTDKQENELYGVQYVDGFMLGNPQLLLSIKAPNRYDKNPIIIEYDLEKKVFAAISLESDIKVDNPVMHIACFNQDLSTIWKQNLDIPYKQNKFDLEQIEIDDNNNIYMLFKIVFNKEQQKQYNLPVADYYFSLLQLGESQEQDYLETVLNIEDKVIYNMQLDVKKKSNKILLTGLYNNKKGDLKPQGVYFTEFEKDSIIPSAIKIQPFNNDFIPDFETESPFTEVTDAEPEIDLINILKSPDGGYYLLGEYKLINETCMPDYRSSLMSCNYNYYYNDIFVFKFDSTGSLQKKLRIPKKQFTRNDGAIYSSFSYGILKNKLVLLYNDHPKNLKPKNPAHLTFMTDAKKSQLAAIIIDENGLVEKEFLVNNDKKKTWCKPLLFFNHQQKSMTLFAEKGRMFQSIEVR